MRVWGIPTAERGSAARSVLELLRGMADAGRSFVMVTHDPGAAARADAVVFLRDGRVVDRLVGAGPHQVADRLAVLEQ
jgi:putative ABC transport system ATP-binding protein